MGDAYNNFGKYKEAIDCYYKSLEIAEELGEKGDMRKTYRNMGDAYHKIGQYGKETDCNRKVLEIAEELGNKGEMGHVSV